MTAAESWTEDALLGRDRRFITPNEQRGSLDLVLLDRDGTLNVLRPDYIARPEDLVLLPGAAEAVARLNSAGARVVLVTNQRGLATGLLTESELVAVHRHLLDLLELAGAHLDGIHVCGHEENTCDCRKPAPGLIHQVFERTPWASKDRAVMLGDTDRDRGAAGTAGVSFLRISEESGGLPQKVEQLLTFLAKPAVEGC